MTKPKLPELYDVKVYDDSIDEVLKHKGRYFDILGKYTTINHYRRDFIFYPTYNQNIKRLGEEDEKIMESFHNENFLSPIEITKIYGMGLGAVASRDIEKYEFLCFYSGDIINQAYANAK